MEKRRKLEDIASVIRAKNAGPFMTTCDIFFSDKESYETVKNSKILTKELVTELYKVHINDVVGIYYHDAALGIKITFIKPKGASSGDVENTDLYGAQQQIPLLQVRIT